MLLYKLVRNTKDWVWKLLLRRMRMDSRLQSGLIVKIRNYAEWCTFNEIFVRCEYDLALDMVLRKPQSDALNVVDCGANVGFFTMRLLDKFLTISSCGALNAFLVEGSPIVVEELKKRVKSIQKKDINVSIYHGLIGLRSGKGSLSLGNGHTLSFVEKDESETKHISHKQKSVSVGYFDVEHILPPEKPLDLLKLDIEGSEFDFISSYPSLLARTRVLVAEFHPHFGSVRDAVETLQSFGLRNVGEFPETKMHPVLTFTNPHV